MVNCPVLVSVFVTTTVTAPVACAAVVAVIEVLLTTVTPTAAVPPRLTVAPLRKPVPVIVTAVPPFAVPAVVMPMLYPSHSFRSVAVVVVTVPVLIYPVARVLVVVVPIVESISPRVPDEECLVVYHHARRWLNHNDGSRYANADADMDLRRCFRWGRNIDSQDHRKYR